ncbi:MAG: hypothetical protein L0Z55_09180 [Planctomycetes bacterium]|nr:hypothetical protein [Planctomycetota bacterium]
MGTVMIWLIAWSVLLWLLGLLLDRFLHRAVVKFVLFPGLLLDALVRIVAGQFVGAKPRQWTPFAPGAPFIAFSPPKWRRIGVALNVALRLFLIFLAAFLTIEICEILLRPGLALPELPQRGAIARITETVVGLFRSIAAVWRHIDFASFSGIIALYIVVTVLLAQSLRHEEFRGALLAWVVIALVAFAVDWIGIRLQLLSRGWLLNWAYGPSIWATFSLLTSLTASLVLAFALFRFMQTLLARRGEE